MRRLAFLGALLLSLALAAPVEAATPAAWGATVSHAGLGGTVTVTAPTATTGARLTASLTGLRPWAMASLSLYGGPVAANVNLVVRTRWAGSFVGGRWHVSVALTPSMWSWFKYEIAHRGGVHLVLAQGARAASAMLVRLSRAIPEPTGSSRAARARRATQPSLHCAYVRTVSGPSAWVCEGLVDEGG